MISELNPNNKEVCCLEFTINFKPTPWKRPAGTAVRYDSQVNDKAAFAILVVDTLRKNGVTLCAGSPIFPTQNLSVVTVFHCKKKGVRIRPKSDVDNLAKFVLDALQSQALAMCIWTDDDQVCELRSIKQFSNEDSITVLIRSLL